LLADLAPDLGWQMTSAQEYPSWYSMTAGSDNDVMKETWVGGWAAMPSLGGNIGAWQMQALAGIRPDPTGPGFKKIIIKPNVVGDLHWADAWYDSVHGRIHVHWRKRNQQLVLDVSIPANTTATIFMPSVNMQSITESGQPVTRVGGLKLRGTTQGRAIIEVVPGHYQFASILPDYH